MSARQFMQAVMHEDITALVKMPGVGKKTAERLVVELKDKLKDIDAPMPTGDNTGLTAPVEVAPILAPVASAKDEAIGALIALGYKRAQAETAIKNVFVEGANSEQLIRDALKSMV
jgi:Holliday junction DNA helicase RuvA